MSVNLEGEEIQVVIEAAGENYSAYSPDLPGCVATGATREEVEANMREALIFHLEGMAEEKDYLAGPEAQRSLREVRVRIERGEGLSFEETFGEKQDPDYRMTGEDHAWMLSELWHLDQMGPHEWPDYDLDDDEPSQSQRE